MWVWDVRIPSTPKFTEELVEFCLKKNINRIFLSAYNFNEPNTINYRRFNRFLHKHNILVYALAGDPRWGLERYHQQPLRWVSNVLSYNRLSKPDERFDGIQSDTEIYLLGAPWESKREQLLREYLDLNKKIMELKRIEDSKIVFGVDIPFWFDDDPTMAVDWNGNFKPPSYHILDTVDSVTVMDYRNFTDGPNGSIELVREEIEYADEVQKKVCIGQETKSNLYPSYITFAGMSEEEMELRFQKLVSTYIKHPSFDGIAIHHYRSYKELVGG